MTGTVVFVALGMFMRRSTSVGPPPAALRSSGVLRLSTPLFFSLFLDLPPFDVPFFLFPMNNQSVWFRRVLPTFFSASTGLAKVSSVGHRV